MNEPLVSILIPSYNAAPWIAETLTSALAQTWERKEVIVVDDGSTDHTREVVQQFVPRGVKLITQDHASASAARNRALREAHGEFIQFLDADDLLAPDKIEIQVRRLEHEPVDSVATCAWAKFQKEVPESTIPAESIWRDLSPIEWLITSWSRGGMMPNHAWLTPRSVIDRAGQWDETPCPNDDGEFFTRVVVNSARVAFCEEARVFYRSVPNSLSARKDATMLAAIYRSIEASTNHLLAVENSERTRRACAALFQDFVYNSYPQVNGYVRRAEEKVASLGGTHIEPTVAGPAHQFLVRVAGWKIAARVRQIYSDVRLGPGSN